MRFVCTPQMFYTCQIVCTEVYRIESARFDRTRAATYQCFGQLEPFRRRRCFRSQLEKLNRPQMTDDLLEIFQWEKCESCYYTGYLTSQCCFVHFYLYFFPLCMLCCTGCYITNHIFLIYKIIKMTVCTEEWFV